LVGIVPDLIQKLVTAYVFVSALPAAIVDRNKLGALKSSGSADQRAGKKFPFSGSESIIVLIQ